MSLGLILFFFLWSQSGTLYISSVSSQRINEVFDWTNKWNASDCNVPGICQPALVVSTSNIEAHTTANGTTNMPEKSVNFGSVSRVTKPGSKCPGMEGADNFTQTQLINRLTAPCRYDRLERPAELLEGDVFGPVVVFARTYIYVINNLDQNDLQLRMHGLLQLRYVDRRLAFGKYAPSRQPILGESELRELIWVPHLFLANEHDSSVLGTNEKDILTSISPDGTVIISSRIQATLYCWMDLKKFPFDEQHCSSVLESWMYNVTELQLHWEDEVPITFDPKMHLTEYALIDAWCNETLVKADENDMRHGAFAGTYSSLNFTVYLVRESGYYIMDYFLPSMMIVAISWVSFWLQADQTPARTTLGTSTMLSFITLASSQDKNLPKVSYIKLSEIWFLVCTLFIFSSLVEFAFVNTIWRRNRNLELKKVNSKYILKSTLRPKGERRKFDCDNGPKIDRSNFSIVASSSNSLSLSVDEDFHNSEACVNTKHRHAWSTMTPQEVSLWIDRKSRFLFPLAFLIFNALFWLLVYCL